LADNSEAIAYWVWQEYQNEAAHKWLDGVSSLIKNVALVLKLLGFVNEQGPFFLDLIFAPNDVTYFVTQTNGVITSTSLNIPPIGGFVISPPAGKVTTTFDFDASTTVDDNDILANLQFRWDFDGDGSWDTPWNSSPDAAHQYTEAGSYHVFMEAIDTHGATASVSHTLNVIGVGTATHVKLFRDAIPWYKISSPWNRDAQVEVLEALGFTHGTGANTYEIISSSSFATVALIPGEDLIILSNDQAQTFYDNYAANQIRFTDFVYNGGSMFWEACDGGWNGGFMDEAGVILPGNVTGLLEVDSYNYVADQALPLVAGMPATMDHNYASHESFIDLPDGVIVYTTDSQNRATLLEFNFGGGWILITGQPLEHQYRQIFGNPDMEELLPRVIGHFTGVVPVAGSFSPPMISDEVGPSSTATDVRE